ncbi:hypothetical protein COEX109129_12125 [Corallococcus exiguus]
MSVTNAASVDVPVTVTLGVLRTAPSIGVLMATTGGVWSTVKVVVAVELFVPWAFVDTAVTVYVPSASGPGSAWLQLPPVTVMGP